MRKIVIFLLVFILLALSLPTAGMAAAKKSSASSTLKAYLKALETFKLSQAYGYFSPSEKKFKKSKVWLSEYPVTFLKAMRLDNKDFFRFTVMEGTDENEITVKTVDLVFPDADISYGFMYKMITKSMKKNKSLKPGNPKHVLQAFKDMVKKEGTTELPFQQVEKKIKMEQIKGKWYVNPGWKEAALKKEEERNQQKLEFEKQSALNKVNFIIGQAKMHPSDFTEPMKELEEIKKKYPDMAEADTGIALVKTFRENFLKVVVTALEPTSNPIFTVVNLEIKNNSEMTLNHFIVEYSFLDSNGKLLKKEEFQFNSSHLDPSEPNGCKPGYAGKTTMGLSVSDSDAISKTWKKTEVRLKGVNFFLE